MKYLGLNRDLKRTRRVCFPKQSRASHGKEVELRVISGRVYPL
jgi:hypothetical protein